MFSKSKKRHTKHEPYLGTISEADELKWEKQKEIAKLKPDELMKYIHTLDKKKSIHTKYEAIPRDSTIIDELYVPKPINASDFLNNNNNSTKYFSSDFLNNSAKSSSSDYKITAGYKRKSKHKHYKNTNRNTNRKTNRKKNTQFRRTIRRLNKKTKNM
jgi:hypothetical protein